MKYITPNNIGLYLKTHTNRWQKSLSSSSTTIMNLGFLFIYYSGLFFYSFDNRSETESIVWPNHLDNRQSCVFRRDSLELTSILLLDRQSKQLFMIHLNEFHFFHWQTTDKKFLTLKVGLWLFQIVAKWMK